MTIKETRTNQLRSNLKAGLVPSDSFPACQNLTESRFGSSAREGWLEDEVSPLSPPPVRQGLSSCQ